MGLPVAMVGVHIYFIWMVVFLFLKLFACLLVSLIICSFCLCSCGQWACCMCFVFSGKKDGICFASGLLHLKNVKNLYIRFWDFILRCAFPPNDTLWASLVSHRRNGYWAFRKMRCLVSALHTESSPWKEEC